MWSRHRGAGLSAARSIAPGLDAEDLVAEAYTKIYELIADGRGPHGAFRPYLYRVIRTLSADAYRSPEDASGELEDIPDLAEAGPWEDNHFDLNAAARAFESLDERWQSVLWYTEVEGMPPREVAKLMRISPNGVSKLHSRARDALRSAWVEAHVTRQIADAECRSTLENLQRYRRGRLTAGLNRRVEAHLAECSDCAKVDQEYSVLNQRLALVLAGIFVGGGAAAAAVVGGAGAQPAMAATLGEAGKPSQVGAAGSGFSVPAIAAAVAAAAVIAVGGVALGVALLQPPDAPPATASVEKDTIVPAGSESDAASRGDRGPGGDSSPSDRKTKRIPDHETKR
ncbi:MAG: sigma-70 family RNA polymerase sigma factor, partial [Leucobacter sp.]